MNRITWVLQINTGDDISLMSKRRLPRFEHKVELHHLTLTRIHPGNVSVREVFEAADVEISNETTNLKFVIVPDCF